MIKKFNNGKIKLALDKKNQKINESFYHDDMFFDNLYINQINGYQYIVDHNKQLVYGLGSYLMQNPLSYLLDTINKEGKIYLYPYTKKESKSLLQDLDNGY